MSRTFNSFYSAPGTATRAQDTRRARVWSTEDEPRDGDSVLTGHLALAVDVIQLCWLEAHGVVPNSPTTQTPEGKARARNSARLAWVDGSIDYWWTTLGLSLDIKPDLDDIQVRHDKRFISSTPDQRGRKLMEPAGWPEEEGDWLWSETG